MLTVLRNRAFRNLFTAQVTALLGTGLATVALGLLAYDIAGPDAGSVLGTALAIKMVAYVALAPILTALAGRLPRRALLISADTLRAAVALALPFAGEIWHVYTLIFVLQAASAAFTPTFQAALPDVLPDERDYTQALSLSRLAYDTESLASPALAAALLTFTTYNWLFLGTAAGFLASAALVLSAALPKHTPTTVTPRRRLANLRADIRHFFTTPQLRALFWMDMAVATAGALVLVNTVVYVREHLDLTTADVALALGAYGTGSMTAALLIPRALGRLSDRRLMLTGALSLPAVHTATAAITTAPTGTWRWPALLTAWCAFGAACSTVLTPAGRLLRRAAGTPEQRTGIFATQFSLSHACWLLTYPLAGWLGAAAGLQAAVTALGLLSLATALLAVHAWPKRATEQHHHAEEHIHTNLPPAHPHLTDAIAVPTGFRHRHTLHPDSLHTA
ncbi:MFS transporter [Streptomyces genisteinicus]|uniref:MFS transporter n=1 Tax=Streptomyces genisteinicus TaxID=2768068 RepID=A0A7H0I300_9ACTN|nr:MFS transporter [Streptomyces genisteinicus]QNP67166.1 MFS transporter [Streptomyces genisteinicus]